MRATQAFTFGARIHPKNLTIFGEPRKRKNKRHRRNASDVTEARQKRSFFSSGAGNGNRTRELRLGSVHFTTKLCLQKHDS